MVSMTARMEYNVRLVDWQGKGVEVMNRNERPRGADTKEEEETHRADELTKSGGDVSKRNKERK